MKFLKNNYKFLIIIVILFSFGFGMLYCKNNAEEKYIRQIEEARKEYNKEEVKFDNAKDATIAKYNDEIDKIESELIKLKADHNKIFFAEGLSENYYASRKLIDDKEARIRELKSKIWDIEHRPYSVFEEPDYDGFSPRGYQILAIFSFVIGGFITLIMFLVNSFRNIGNVSYKSSVEVSKVVLSNCDIKNGNVLKKELFEKLDKLLVASTKEDYKTIKSLCTPNMAKNYIDEIELLKKHKQIQVLKGIENTGSKITRVVKNYNNTTVTLLQKVELFDYIEDSTGKVISGDKKKKVEQAYKLVFVKDNVSAKVKGKCPNCGANMKDLTATECEYCGTVIDDKKYDWYLVSKVLIDVE